MYRNAVALACGLIFISACRAPQSSDVRREFLTGLAYRKHDPKLSNAYFAKAEAHAIAIVRNSVDPAEKIEAISVLARMSLEKKEFESAERWLGDGRTFFGQHDPQQIWRGDELAVFTMKGDFHQGREDYDRALAEYILAESRCTGAIRSFVNLRIIQVQVKRGTETALTNARSRIAREMKTPGSFQDEFQELHKVVEAQLKDG